MGTPKLYTFILMYFWQGLTSWEKIAVALESPVLGEPQLAEELREKFCKKEEPPRKC